MVDHPVEKLFFVNCLYQKVRYLKMPKQPRLLYITHLFPRSAFPEYGLDAYNASVRVNGNVLVVTRRFKGVFS